MSAEPYTHPTAVVDPGASLGEGTKVWHFCHIMPDARIGKRCILGQNVFVGSGVPIGDDVKIQNNVSVYPGVEIEDAVFVGPSAVFTNVINPRSEVERKDEFRPTLVRRGATIGANATVLCGTTLGRGCFVGAGAVVTKDVPDHGLVYGTPARLRGWMCACGERLARLGDPGRGDDDDTAEGECAACGRAYRRRGFTVEETSGPA